MTGRATRPPWTPGPHAAVVDWERVREVYALCAAHPDRDRWSTLVGMFLDDAQQRVVRLDEAVRSGHAAEAYELAHSLRGSSATFGASGILELTRRLESLATGGEMEAAAGVVRRLASECERVRCALAPADRRTR